MVITFVFSKGIVTVSILNRLSLLVPTWKMDARDDVLSIMQPNTGTPRNNIA